MTSDAALCQSCLKQDLDKAQFRRTDLPAAEPAPVPRHRLKKGPKFSWSLRPSLEEGE